VDAARKPQGMQGHSDDFRTKLIARAAAYFQREGGTATPLVRHASCQHNDAALGSVPTW